jgi:hypothetical protein
MAIYKISGQMLQSVLVRDAINLSVANTANTTSVLFVDVANSRVGINSNVANVALDVVGNIAGGNISLSSNVTAAAINTGNIASTGNINITTTGSNVAIFSGSTGVVIPAGNTAQRPSPAAVGTIRVNTALNQIEAYDGTAWVGGGSSGNVSIADQQFNGDGSTLAFSLDEPATADSVLVIINGVSQLPAVAYSVTANVITFAEAPLSSDRVDIRFLASASASFAIRNTSGNASVAVLDTPRILFNVASSNVAEIDSDGVFNISTGHSLQLPSYSVAQAANLANVAVGQLIYVSNGDTGNPCLAVYSGGAFKRVSFGANIST